MPPIAEPGFRMDLHPQLHTAVQQFHLEATMAQDKGVTEANLTEHPIAILLLQVLTAAFVYHSSFVLCASQHLR